MTQLLPVDLRGILPQSRRPNLKAMLILQLDLTKGHSCVHAGLAVAGHSRNSLQA
jgi:hypothetical protein